MAQRRDLAAEYLRFERVAPTIARNEWRTAKVWQRLLGYAGHAGLDGLGMTPQQRKSFKKLLAETIELGIEGVTWAAEFLTPELRRVAIRYRHSLSVLSPASSPIFVTSGLSPRLMRRVAESIVVLDIDAAGKDRVLALRARPEDLSDTVDAARRIAAPAIVVAGSVLLEADSPAHRGLMAMTDSRALTDPEREALALYHGWLIEEGRVISGAPGTVARNMDPFYRMAPVTVPAPVRDDPSSPGQPDRA